MKLSINQIKYTFWVLVSLTWITLFIINKDTNGIHWSELVRNNGRLAWYLLTFTIYIGLARKIFKYSWVRKLCSIRKHTGVFAFLVATSHFIFEFIKRYSHYNTSISSFIKISLTSEYAMIFGTLAYLFMLPAFLTSTNSAILKIGAKRWKLIQRLAHITFVLGTIHFALVHRFTGGDIKLEPIITLLVYILAYLFLYIKKKKNTSAIST